MNSLMLIVLNGLTYGGLLFIVASGFSLIFGLMRVVNLSHGTFYILGAYVAYSIQQQSGDWVIAVLGATTAAGFSAVITHRLLVHVNGEMPRTLLTIGVSLIIADLCLWIWGGLPLRLRAPEILRAPITIGDVLTPLNWTEG
jgi:branched-chain amino acid transport system permease protein